MMGKRIQIGQTDPVAVRIESQIVKGVDKVQIDLNAVVCLFTNERGSESRLSSGRAAKV